ncbi:MAG TPA: transporter permease, partial [Cytophagales bacterium]|nr:transporter permease [Cytophagales bacterium]
LSKFSPIKVRKGTLGQPSGDTWARRGLVIFQFAVSVILLVAVSVVYRQVKYTQNMHLGYNQEFLIRVGMDGSLEAKLDVFLEEAAKLPGVQSASATSHSMMGHNSSTNGVSWEGKNPDDRIPFELYWVHPGVFET